METTTNQLRAQIRFSLAQLSPLNDHHQFEHLTRHFARLRIASNILPATGPASAGGDQGRDFETFRSYITNTPIATSIFVALVRRKKLVFACSLQKDKIESKIRSDIATIVGSGVHVDDVYYFCEIDLPVSKRHALQEWAKLNHAVALEIIDGQGLAEQLTEPDVWWIAQEFLSIPSAVFPKSFAEGGRYAELRHEWLENDREPVTFADFTEIDAGLRQAMYEVGCRADLPDWIKKIKTFLTDDCPERLRRKVQYEIAVASLRGLNRLSAEAPLVIPFFDSLNDKLTPAELEDASVLLTYCSTSALLGHFDIEHETLAKWSARLTELLDAAIANKPPTGALCSLLQTRARICTIPFRTTNPKAQGPDLALAVTFWFKLLDQVSGAPLFPLEQFADILTAVTPAIKNDPRFRRLTDRVDQLLEERTSGFVAAEKCRGRAVALYKDSDFVGALKQLQRAKVKWFAAETLRGSLGAMLVAADCYEKLGLLYAAKYYAAGVFHVCLSHDDERFRTLAPQAGFVLAQSCYRSGDWVSFLRVLRLALFAQQSYVPEPFDFEKHEDVKRHLTHCAILRAVTKRLAPDLVVVVDGIGDEWEIEDLWDVVRELSEDDKSPWPTMSLDALWNHIQEDAFGPPFADVGARRIIRWKALGITWSISFDNTYELTLLGEEVAATLQILQADLADTDLCLLPTTADIDLALAEGAKMEFEEVPGNDRARWKIRLPATGVVRGDQETEFPIAMGVAAITLGQCSVLPSEQFHRILESAFDGGLATKAFSIRPARELFGRILSNEEFESSSYRMLEAPQPPASFEIQPSAQLKWWDKLGPGYSREKAERFLRNRYKHGIPPIRLTLPRLLADSHTRSLIRKLREDGMLDWQILNIIACVVINFRLHLKHGRTATPQVLTEEFMEQMFREEQEDAPAFPLALFSEEELALAKRVALVGYLKTWGLMSQSVTPDFSAIERFLNARYRNSKDDIPHEQILVDLSETKIM